MLGAFVQLEKKSSNPVMLPSIWNTKESTSVWTAGFMESWTVVSDNARHRQESARDHTSGTTDLT